jgi:hypothetical protein
MRGICLALVGALIYGGVAAGQSPDELGARAQDILRRHCFVCHGQDLKTVRAGLNILERGQLMGRKLVVPQAADDSELLGFIEDGTMPPAGRPAMPKEDRAILRAWIQAGAPPFPDLQLGNPYVLRSIFEDVKKLPKQERAAVRYFSLNHLLAEERTRRELPRRRETLVLAIAFLSRAEGKPARPVAIEPSATVYRVNLAELGWNRKPYDNSPLTLFDLVLLEYPYGVADVTDRVYQELAEVFLLPAAQARPIPYLRGDWFIALTAQPAFNWDFRQIAFRERRSPLVVDSALEASAQQFDAEPLTPAEAAAELGLANALTKLTHLLETAAFENDPVRTLAVKGSVDRLTWETSFPRVIRALDLGNAIEAVDATVRTEAAGEPTPEVELRTNHVDNVFEPKQDVVLTVHNRSKKLMYVELIGVGGRIESVQKPTPVDAGETRTVPVGQTSSKPGKDTILLFAAEKEFPPYALAGGGEDKLRLDREKGITSRIVHPLFALSRTNQGVRLRADPGPMVRRTIVVETRLPG